LVGVVE